MREDRDCPNQDLSTPVRKQKSVHIAQYTQTYNYIVHDYVKFTGVKVSGNTFQKDGYVQDDQIF